ncbi:MAG: hypothetical protein L0207_00090 [Chlamydiae bacterium]|nr:hypothetical protein [Chlamydiota bacterium]
MDDQMNMMQMTHMMGTMKFFGWAVIIALVIQIILLAKICKELRSENRGGKK